MLSSPLNIYLKQQLYRRPSGTICLRILPLIAEVLAIKHKPHPLLPVHTAAAVLVLDLQAREAGC
jgi:hypothetical protein